jgi:hypothetical protein
MKESRGWSVIDCPWLVDLTSSPSAPHLLSRLSTLHIRNYLCVSPLPSVLRISVDDSDEHSFSMLSPSSISSSLVTSIVRKNHVAFSTQAPLLPPHDHPKLNLLLSYPSFLLLVDCREDVPYLNREYHVAHYCRCLYPFPPDSSNHGLCSKTSNVYRLYNTPLIRYKRSSLL